MDSQRPAAETEAKLPVTVLIATKNEADNVGPCIDSVGRAAAVYVIDSNSTDRTAEIAASKGAEVVPFDYDGAWPKKRNWALRNLPIDTEWVLILDADERVSGDLWDEIASVLPDPRFDGYYLQWQFVFLGAWMKHSWSHGWMARLFRAGKGEYEDLGMRTEGGWDAEVHENVVVTGQTRRLNSELIHHSNSDLHSWIMKQNEFSTWNAVRRTAQLGEPMPSIRGLFSGDPLRRRRWMKALFIRLPVRPTLMFLYLYFFKRGFLDGKAGYYFCRLRAIHEFNVAAKVFELHRGSTPHRADKV